MARALDIAFTAICLAIIAVVLVDFPHQLPDSGTSTCTATTTTTTQVPTKSTHQLVLPVAAAATLALLAAVSLVFRHLHHAQAGDRRLSEPVAFTLCASAGILQYVLFVQKPAGFVIDVGARARALGLAAARALPVAATVSFFLAVALVLVVHVRGGGARGRGGAVAGDDPVVQVLSKMAVEAAAVLVGLMAMALYTTY
ncbi:hypothetical protein QOZ80_6AG0512640 [Eleusine coracana subsp. coracana]|nr:hypothetical protein QOZ80_6AG0512640 [Eleusine coracana subsp. coracana]